MKIKNYLASFKTYIFIGITFIGFITILAGLGFKGRWNTPGDGNIYFIGIGLLLLVPAIIWYVKSRRQDKKINDRLKEKIELLKKTGEKITINLDLVKIKPSQLQEKIITDNTTYSGLNGLAGREDRNFKIVNKTVNQLTLIKSHKGRKIKYQESIVMDSDNLKIHFAIQKNTILYIDPNDGKNMYLDLEFLN